MTQYLHANQKLIRSGRGLHALLHGASEYLNRTGPRADASPFRSDLVVALTNLMREENPPRLRLPWLDRHAVRLLTFASRENYLEAMQVVARRRLRRLWAITLATLLVIILSWMLPRILSWMLPR